MRFLLWLALAALVIWVLLAPRRRTGAKASPQPENKPAADGETMHRCQYCGLHIPASEAVLDAGAAFCSEEHRRLHQSSR